MTIHEAMESTGRARKEDWDIGIYIYVQAMGFIMAFPGATGVIVTVPYNNTCITDDDWVSCV